MVATAPRIVLVGGGYVGMYTALRLRRKLRPGEAHITVIDKQSYMTYQPFLPEAAAGNVEPRHVIAPLRRTLRGCEVIKGNVTGIDTTRQLVTVELRSDETAEIGYDHLVACPGSVARTLPIPGLAEQGIGFKRVEEAIFLRNHVIDQLDAAVTASDATARRKALTFVFVGGGYAGIEALAELEDMVRFATRYYDGITAGDLRFVLVEATGRILPEVGEDMGRYTVEQLRHRGIEVRLNTRLESAVDGDIELSDGSRFASNTLVWTAGVKPHPLLANTGLPLDDKGRVRTGPDLQVLGMPDHWSAGDCAAVPDLTAPGQFCGPSAQHAVRQARVLGDNIVAALRGEPLHVYKHKYAGSVASLGLHKGVAQIYGVKLRGWPAWFMHRTYHASRMPTLNRKLRVIADWTEALLFQREVSSLGALQQPRDEFQLAAGRPRKDDGHA